MGILGDSEDPEEMYYNAAFHQSLHCLIQLKPPSGAEIHHNLDLWPHKIQNGQFHTYYINMYWEIQQNTKG